MAHRLTPGSRIAGYRLEEQVGQGGMAVVFRARDERLDRLVALKILGPALAGDGDFRRRFVRESRAAAMIDDPHIVPLFAAGEADGVLFIAMRYVAGGDAQSLLCRDGPLPQGRVAAIISPVASALDAAHRAGLVHRDVKPSNMLMDVLPGRPDHVYLSDFGLCKPVADTSGVTAAGAVIGTLAYMSPERIGTRPADGRADQYALACSAFELLAGAPPFRGDDPAAVMYAHLSQTPPPLTARRQGLPAAVDAVLSKALAKAPGERYASCGQFADALRDALALPPYRPSPRAQPATEASVLPTVADIGPAKSPRQLGRRVVIAACILVAAGLASGLLLSGSPAHTTTIPISVKSVLPAATGDVYVVYLDGNQANAEVYGDVGKAVDGGVAELYAQQFPYQKAPVRVSSVILHPVGTTARYQFKVTPTVATRYRVEVFRSSTSATPFAISGIATIYVTLGVETQENAHTCSPPLCYETVQQTFFVPPSALQTEISKPLYLYFGHNLARSKAPAKPQSLALNGGSGVLIAKTHISADEYSATVTFSFGVGNDHYSWAWKACAKDTEAEDGVGLPGQHGCGDQNIPYPGSYLG